MFLLLRFADINIAVVDGTCFQAKLLRYFSSRIHRAFHELCGYFDGVVVLCLLL
jgi:hypothetical protein